MVSAAKYGPIAYEYFANTDAFLSLDLRNEVQFFALCFSKGAGSESGNRRIG